MKKYNDNKICFVICSNDERYLDECVLYINLLKIPKGYSAELLVIKDAQSMAAGYNEAMNSSDAKYKVYLHQDTFIVDKNFIKKIINIFESDSKIGMIGMVGTERLAKDGVMWHGTRCGNFYRLDEINKIVDSGITKVKSGIQEVEVIDGLIMIHIIKFKI